MLLRLQDTDATEVNRLREAGMMVFSDVVDQCEDPMSSCIDAWGLRTPAFIAKIRTTYSRSGRARGCDEKLGTGLVVDAQHVVTCAHVACPFPPNDWQPEHPMLDLLWGERRDRNWGIDVDCAGHSRSAEPIAQLPGVDLTLLRLGDPVHGVRAPIGRRCPLDQAPKQAYLVSYAGAEGQPRLTTLFDFFAKSAHKTVGPLGFKTSTVTSVGTDPGSSGASVFTADDGDPVFVGIVTARDLRDGTGRMVPAETVERLVALAPEARTEHDPGVTLDERSRRLRWEGLDSTIHNINRGRPIALVPMPAMPEHGVLHPYLIAPAAYGDAASRGGRVTRTNVADATALLNDVRKLLGHREVRLPTLEELSIAWQAGGTLKIRALMERIEPGQEPHWRNAWGIWVPPSGCGEWIRPSSDGGPNVLRVDGSGSRTMLRSTRLDPREGWPYVGFRFVVPGAIP